MGVIYGPLMNEQREQHLKVLGGSLVYDEIYAADLAEQQCTVCGKQMTYPGIIWTTPTRQGDLYFHPACVMHWMIRLVRDVHQAECISGRSTTRDPFEMPNR